MLNLSTSIKYLHKISVVPFSPKCILVIWISRYFWGSVLLRWWKFFKNIDFYVLCFFIYNKLLNFSYVTTVSIIDFLSLHLANALASVFLYLLNLPPLFLIQNLFINSSLNLNHLAFLLNPLSLNHSTLQKKRITLAFNREAQNDIFIAESDSPADTTVFKNKVSNNNNLELIEPQKYNPQLIVHLLSSDTSKDIEDSVKSVSSLSPDSIKIILISKNPARFPLSNFFCCMVTNCIHRQNQYWLVLVPCQALL